MKPNIVLHNAVGEVLIITMRRDKQPLQTFMCLSPGSRTPALSC